VGYLERLDSYKEEMLATLGDSIAIDSVETEPVKSSTGELMPFGKGIRDALLHILSVGEEMGFDTYNCDNYGGYIEYKAPRNGSEKPEQLGISGHIDVMPAGTGWTGDPFDMVEKDGFVYGRGVSDDKGPVFASLYAMKALKDEGIEPKMDIRLIIGCDEETNKAGMEYYLEKCGQPDMGFTPDGMFPLVNGEMGILIFDLAQKLGKDIGGDKLRMTKFESGTAPNAVPREARAVLMGTEEQYEEVKEIIEKYVAETGYNVKARKQGSALAIEAEGLAAHGAHPDLGLNPITILMELFGRVEFGSDELNDFIRAYNEHIGFDFHGERIGCAFEDKQSGKLIFNVGMANINEELANLTINIRYPVTCTDNQVFEGIEKALSDTKVGILKNMVEGPIYLPTDDPMVEKMMAAYREETGDKKSGPIVEAGGTYAKIINKTLAFGALFPGEEDTMHQADEKMSIESYYKMARIYAKALYYICCE